MVFARADGGQSPIEREKGTQVSQNQESDDYEVRLDECQQVLRYVFSDRLLLRCCLTHSSMARSRLESNERLEFLGDAILGLVVCELVYQRFPDLPEGELTRIKSSLVSRNTCADIAEELQLADFMFLGKGLIRHAKIPLSVLAGVYESVVAGIYLDGGLSAARAFVETTLSERVDRVARFGHMRNFKSLLQQMSQQTSGDTPIYMLLDEKGPDHSKCFKVAAVVGTTSFAAAWGNSKKEAEQRAAQNAVFQLEGSDPPHTAD